MSKKKKEREKTTQNFEVNKQTTEKQWDFHEKKGVPSRHGECLDKHME